MFRPQLVSFLLLILLDFTAAAQDLPHSSSPAHLNFLQDLSSSSTPSVGEIDHTVQVQDQGQDQLSNRNTHLELTKPFSGADPLTPSCILTLSLLPHHPLPYSPPSGCGCSDESTWSGVTLCLQASVTAHPHQPPSNDILSLWLGGAELLRMTVPESPVRTASWETLKDITRYASLLRESNIQILLTSTTPTDLSSAMYDVKLTIVYYGVRQLDPTLS